MPSAINKSDSVQKLQKLICQLDYVQEFQKIEKNLLTDELIFRDYEKMKDLQKQAVLFKKIGKMQAFKESSQKAQKLEKKLKIDPLVAEYFQKMQDVSDLLQYLTDEIEQKFNEKL